MTKQSINGISLKHTKNLHRWRKHQGGWIGSILSNQEQDKDTITAFCLLNNVSEVPVSTKVG